jgi:hypothetical protein
MSRNMSGGLKASFSQSRAYKRASIIFHVSDPSLEAWTMHWQSRLSLARYDLNNAKIITPPWPAWVNRTSVLLPPSSRTWENG